MLEGVLHSNEVYRAIRDVCDKHKQFTTTPPIIIKPSAFHDGVNVSVYRIHKEQIHLLNDMICSKFANSGWLILCIDKVENNFVNVVHRPIFGQEFEKYHCDITLIDGAKNEDGKFMNDEEKKQFLKTHLSRVANQNIQWLQLPQILRNVV